VRFKMVRQASLFVVVYVRVEGLDARPSLSKSTRSLLIQYADVQGLQKCVPGIKTRSHSCEVVTMEICFNGHLRCSRSLGWWSCRTDLILESLCLFTAYGPFQSNEQPSSSPMGRQGRAQSIPTPLDSMNLVLCS
jgi:hypothetical protein